MTSEIQDLFDELSSAVTSQKASFGCGGKIQVDTTDSFAHLTTQHVPITSPPVVVRWSGEHSKLTLPLEENENPAFLDLLQNCSPATFGRDGEEVLDQAYRKAGKLDNSQFCTNFNP